MAAHRDPRPGPGPGGHRSEGERMTSAAAEAPACTSDEMMTVTAAKALRDGSACFVGIGLPSTAANLARRTHAPGLWMIYESGTLGATPSALPLSIGDGELAETADTVVSVPEVFNYWLQPGRIDAAGTLPCRTPAPGRGMTYEAGTLGATPSALPLSIGDGELAETADAVVSVPEVFNYWLQPGRIDVGFLGAAQIDRYGNINTTVIGDYDAPKVRLPGAGGAPEIAADCRGVMVIVRQSRRAFVESVDFTTSGGHGSGRGGRERLGLRGAGPTRVITDLG